MSIAGCSKAVTRRKFIGAMRAEELVFGALVPAYGIFGTPYMIARLKASR